MKLKTVRFCAFRSLLDVELDFSRNCLALVGVNESGKSNVLRGLSMLSTENQLTKSDTPKMARERDPEIRFLFELQKADIETLAPLIEDRIGGSVPIEHVTYVVRLDSDTGTERRYFELSEAKLPEGTYFRKHDANTARYTIVLDDKARPLEDVLFITEQQLRQNEEIIAAANDLVQLNTEVGDVETALTSDREQLKQIESQQAVILSKVEAERTDVENSDLAVINEQMKKVATSIAKHEATLRKQTSRLETLTARASACTLPMDLQQVREEIDSQESVIQGIEQKIALAKKATTDEAKAEQEEMAASAERLHSLSTKMVELKQSEESLLQPLRERFSNEPEEFQKRIGSVVRGELETLMPQVVSWKYSSKYILQGETEFQEILSGLSFDSISRPLLNVFRIGLDISTFDELRGALNEIQTDPSERSRLRDRLNRRLDEYLKSVWKDYDQEINISLESDRIRLEFFDPDCTDASYYKMQERSQGCQTFISFLLTLGAEAKQGVITNTVLLLDEPETHLHPSGVRYMLQELKAAADEGNLVVFATHSVFMIDQSDYDRHIIVKKKQERTELLPSVRARIGYFMQEEVLYSALDVDVASELQPRRQHSFVFEGHGDATLFESFYRIGLKGATRPYDMNKTSFYHGGKCSDIKRYFSQKPIQLGTDWVFILDSDEPAHQLRDFLEGKYKPFIGQFIHVFQFERDGIETDLELEDLLPARVVQDALKEVAEVMQIDVELGHSAADMSFAEYLEKALAPCQSPKELKAAFKERLNKRIMDMTPTIDEPAKFQAEFPEFFAWGKAVIDQLDERKPRKSSSRTPKKATGKESD